MRWDDDVFEKPPHTPRLNDPQLDKEDKTILTYIHS